jgi:hypothetical protein
MRSAHRQVAFFSRAMRAMFSNSASLSTFRRKMSASSAAAISSSRLPTPA